MKKTVMDTICSSFDSFFDSEKKIAKYIINNYDKVVEMTVGQLASASGSSEASVSRFCKKIGVKGFHHLKISLAKEMVDIGKGAGRKMAAIVSDMNQPLGNAVGNSLEVKEAIDTLNGKGPKDLTELCIVLGSHIIYQAGIVNSLTEAEEKLKCILADKSALKKFADFVEAQGGDRRVAFNTDLLPQAKHVYNVSATQSGYIKHIHSAEIGTALVRLGGGREVKGESIDSSVGIIINKKIGDYVTENDTIATIYANDITNLNEVIDRIKDAYSYSVEPVEQDLLIRKVIN